jgi:uncharacterized protein
MRVTEKAVSFSCEGQHLLGMLCTPETPTGTGVVIVVGGPQYRAGSHRQFVQLARHLAEGGFATLRFDVRGMGDSEGEPRSFEQLGADIGAAIDTLMREVPQTRQVVLWGLCDGASAALLYLDERPDARVCGLALANPWVRTPASAARTQVRHYYRQRLKQWGFWSRALNPMVLGRAAAGFAGSLLAARRASARPVGIALGYADRMARSWAAFEGPVLLMLSEHDTTAREFEDACGEQAAWQQAVSRRPPQRQRLSGADHTCSQPQAQQALQRATLHWLVHPAGT